MTGIFSFSIEAVCSSRIRLPSCKLNYLPSNVLGHITSYLDPDCVVNSLIPACPGLVFKLCNGVQWKQVTSPKLLLYVRSVALAAVTTVTTLAVPCVPSEQTSRCKWQRLLKSDNLKRLHVGNECYLAKEKVLHIFTNFIVLVFSQFASVSIKPQRHKVYRCGRKRILWFRICLASV